MRKFWNTDETEAYTQSKIGTTNFNNASGPHVLWLKNFHFEAHMTIFSMLFKKNGKLEFKRQLQSPHSIWIDTPRLFQHRHILTGAPKILYLGFDDLKRDMTMDSNSIYVFIRRNKPILNLVHQTVRTKREYSRQIDKLGEMKDCTLHSTCAPRTGRLAYFFCPRSKLTSADCCRPSFSFLF